MQCVSKQVAVGTETIDFGRKVKIHHIIFVGVAGLTQVTFDFDRSGPFPYTPAWNVFRLVVRSPSNINFQCVDVNMECRNIRITVATTATVINFFFEYKYAKRKRKK